MQGETMVAINIEYVGDLHCRATHLPSGAELITDAPADNMGKGETFSPTDLVATALGTCILTVMGTKAQSMGIDLSGSTVVVDKEMASGPRRIGRLATSVVIPHQISDRDKKVLEATAFTCPVHKSMSSEVDMPITFEWAE
jgi:putative redox protein